MRAYVPAYDVTAAIDLDHALRLLAEAPGEVRVLAGGTDLMVLLESGDLPPGRFVSIWGLPELKGIQVADDAITLGALTTYREIQAHPVVRAEYPMLCEAARLTGALAIQNRGTIGGNIMNASPAADSPPGLLVYGAEVEFVSRRGTRRRPYDGFHSGYKKMDARPDELLKSVRLPRRPGGDRTVHYFRKVGTRGAQAISKVVFAALGRREGDAVAELRIALGSVAPTVVRAPRTEAALLGAPLTPAAIEAARRTLAAEISPIDDIRSTRRYRQRVAGNLLAEFLERLLGA